MRCALPSKAPLVDLQAIHQMRQYREVDMDVANQCLESMACHPWYLCPQLVILCLVDEKVPEKERKAVAVARQGLRQTPSCQGNPSFPR